jgi:hypothetical protein
MHLKEYKITLYKKDIIYTVIMVLVLEINSSTNHIGIATFLLNANMVNKYNQHHYFVIENLKHILQKCKSQRTR